MTVNDAIWQAATAIWAFSWLVTFFCWRSAYKNAERLLSVSAALQDQNAALRAELAWMRQDAIELED